MKFAVLPKLPSLTVIGTWCISAPGQYMHHEVVETSYGGKVHPLADVGYVLVKGQRVTACNEATLSR